MRFIGFLFILLLSIHLVYAESTFFDNPDDVFVAGNSATEGSAPGSGTTGGTSGGGGSGCTTNWTCASWSSCTNGIQTRNCTKLKTDCYADLKIKPIESQNCSIIHSENKSAEEKPIEVNKEEKTAEILEKEPTKENQIERPSYPFVATTLFIVFVLGWIYYLWKKK